MAEPRLSLEHLALIDEMGGDTMAEPMQSRPVHAGRGTEPPELLG